MAQNVGQYNVGGVTLASGQDSKLQLDASGNLKTTGGGAGGSTMVTLTSPADAAGIPYVDTGSPNPVYISSFTFNPATTLAANDIVVLKNPSGSGKVIRLLGFSFKFTATAASAVTYALNYYTGAPSGGTPVAQTIVPYDSAFGVAAAIVDSYATTSQTDGTLVGSVSGQTGATGTAASALGNLSVFAPTLPGSPSITLRAGSYLGLLVTATSATGLSGTFQIVWSEGAG